MECLLTIAPLKSVGRVEINPIELRPGMVLVGNRS